METTLNTCPSAEQTIAGYIDGNLSTDDRISFERHMASCQVCRTIEHELRMTQSLLRTLPSVAPRDDFEARLATRIARVKLKPAPWWTRLMMPAYIQPARRPHVAIPFVAAASVVASFRFVQVSRVPTVKTGTVQTAAASADENAVLSELANQHHAASASQSLGDTSGVVVVASDMATGGSW